ncbi:hypothetical protein [Nocardia sp. NPDC057440]|uniref:hypothetical protein n=1 Tax=Nocardia sp. NPDC057440 TaxID=3346134 RepID=UPI00366D0F1E
MSPEATEAMARRRLHQYFIETLHMLPPNFTLSLHNPAAPLARFHTGITLPCDDNDDDGIGPKYFDISYWILGSTPETSDLHFDLLVRGWRQRGWTTKPDRDARPRAAYTRTPDSYGLTIQQSINGYLSLSGSTPPFPSDTAGANPLPATIENSLSERQINGGSDLGVG